MITSQLNPAWRRRSHSSDRLAKVGQSFLSDEENSASGEALCRAITFLLAPQHKPIVSHLNLILHRTGHRSTVLESEHEAAYQAHIAGSDQQQLHLLPVTDVAMLRGTRMNRLLLLIEADLDAVRDGYRQIKLLNESGAPEIGVVVVGARDQHAAWRYYRKLAVGTLRYLDVPLLNFGFLPPSDTAEQVQLDGFLSRIGERLVERDFFDRIAQRTEGASA